MKKLLLALFVSGALYACGPSSSTTNENDTPINISSSPTGDTAITDGGTGAAKGAEADTTSSSTLPTVPRDTTTAP